METTVSVKNMLDIKKEIEICERKKKLNILVGKLSQNNEGRFLKKIIH